MTAAAEIYDRGWAEGWQPEPELTVSAWADAHRQLSGVAAAEPGQWRTSRAPYLREIMDSLSASSPVRRVVFMKGAQIGATEAGNNWLGYIMDCAPGPALMIHPNLDAVKKVSRQRLDPMIEASPRLQGKVAAAKSRDPGNTVSQKTFPGGILSIATAGSAASLRSMPVRYLFADEVDGYPGDVGDEGDPIKLAEQRTATFRRAKKIYLVSTPTVKGVSRIGREFGRGDG